jgi:ABC-type sugar transport system ATPase subunit
VSSNASPSVISLRSIGKTFPGVRALSDVSFDVRFGELVAICGENGAGKSTLMKILSGVITDYDGQLWMAPDPTTSPSLRKFHGTRDAEDAGISIIHQELNLVEQLSIAANIFLGRELKNSLGMIDNTKMSQVASQHLRELECNASPDDLAGSLRVGDQQLVEIAKAICTNRQVLIMDEPTSALTEAEVERLDRVIAKLRQRGTTILYISHKMDEVFRLSDRIVVLRDGQWITTLNTSETDPSEVARHMVGRELATMERLEGHRTKGPEVLQVDRLSLPWPGHARGYRLKEISFSLREGEILGIAGLMGAGRTELLECLFGASPVRPSGTMKLFGAPYAPRHPSDACQAGIALVTEDRKRLGIFPTMNVGENITVSSLDQATSMGSLSSRREVAMADRMVEKLRVKTSSLDAMITGLSGGNQQKCIVGRWLLTDPKILLLDDPTRGVDVGAKAELYRLIRQLCDEGLSVVLTSSELPELLALSDRILVLSEGRLTDQMDISEATQERILEAATGGYTKTA